MAEKEPNEGLNRLLAEADWSLGQLATAINRAGEEAGVSVRADKSNVSKWLKGHTPVEKVRPLILEAMSRRLGRQVTHAEAGLPAPKDGPSAPGTVEGLVDLGRADMDPSRRSVLGAGLYSVALTIPGWPDVIGRAEAVKKGKGLRYGFAEVDMVVQMTEKVSELDDQFGGRTARPMAATFLVNTVAPYLRADAPEDVRQAMMSAASDLCYLTGYMAVDEGLHGLAQSYYLKALELAGAAEDHLTYCTTLRGMSVQAVDLGHGPDALRLAEAAAAASPKAGPRMLAFLTGQQAHAAAQEGDRTAALRYIREAEAAMDRAESRGKPLGSYDPAALNYHTAQVRYELGDVHGSIEALEESNRVRFSVYRRGNVRMRALLAERQLQVGHLEEAVKTWHAALDDYPLVHSGRADERIANMRRLIRPHLRHHGAAELYDRAQQMKPAAV
ncbi:tetratricopeptide repeat protein [Streptomyces sp. ALI-76-A]|uniref:tetratricopeptide repeat protein n=1 Tax=Streptomyces sp. ALI-76-A TaxID=3025736 RepID=UPI00256EAE5C|nr:tetratricopeptide repeat protein [Streptomyces sp. ALI-76-A]MDL5204952.1 tetratricopeptide repeat protein [Streptomyces sp. ALI-76-A]